MSLQIGNSTNRGNEQRRTTRTSSFSSATSSAENDSVTSSHIIVPRQRKTSRREMIESGMQATGSRSVRARLQPPMENTYQLRPTKLFPVANVRRVVKEILNVHASQYSYNPKQVHHHLKLITSEIKSKVKALGLPRYKLVCYTLLMSKHGQGALSASRCLWDSGNCDNFVVATMETNDFVVVASVYGIYQE